MWGNGKGGAASLEAADAAYVDTTEVDLAELSTDQIVRNTRGMEDENRVLKGELERIRHETAAVRVHLEDNLAKIKRNKVLPYLVSNIIEVLDVDPEELEAEDGAAVDLDAQTKGKCVVVKTSTRQTVFLPVPGLVEVDKLQPGDLVGVNKDSYLILEKLPAEYDTRVKAMEIDDAPKEDFQSIGGLTGQLEELIEAIIWPLGENLAKFKALNIQPPKGVLFYGPPGTGKTLTARACAAECKACFLKLAGPQLVQMYIGDGSRLVRDLFALAKEKQPSIVFIDELDAIGTKRADSELSGGREVQRTMLELLNQMDGFSANENIKVIGATNRVDVLDPALLRSGRFDRKIEFPHPNDAARVNIFKIHVRPMTVRGDVNFEELARSTEEFNGAMIKAVCVEAGMLALRREGIELTHEDFVEGINVVKSKKKTSLQYYA